MLAVLGEHSLMHILLRVLMVLCGCKSCSTRGWEGRESFALDSRQVYRCVIFSHVALQLDSGAECLLTFFSWHPGTAAVGPCTCPVEAVS